MLTDDERNRYSRHLLLPQIGEEGQEKLKAASALIVGVGGLGSPAAMYLTAAGIGRLGLVDFDTVDESNLQRQILYGESVIGERKLDAAWKRLRDLNRNLRIETFNDRLSSRNALPLMEPYDIVLCSLALHHFSDEDAVRVVRRCRELSRKFVLVSDLRRGLLATIGVYLLTALIFREPMTRYDGRLSAVRAFSFTEMDELARQAGWKNFCHRKFRFAQQAIWLEDATST